MASSDQSDNDFHMVIRVYTTDGKVGVHRLPLPLTVEDRVPFFGDLLDEARKLGSNSGYISFEHPLTYYDPRHVVRVEFGFADAQKQVPEIQEEIRSAGFPVEREGR